MLGLDCVCWHTNQTSRSTSGCLFGNKRFVFTDILFDWKMRSPVHRLNGSSLCQASDDTDWERGNRQSLFWSYLPNSSMSSPSVIGIVKDWMMTGTNSDTLSSSVTSTKIGNRRIEPFEISSSIDYCRDSKCRCFRCSYAFEFLPSSTIPEPPVKISFWEFFEKIIVAMIQTVIYFCFRRKISSENFYWGFQIKSLSSSVPK